MSANQLGLLMMFAGVVCAPLTLLWWVVRRREARHAQAVAVLAMLDRGALDTRFERHYQEADTREQRISVAVETVSLAVAIVGLVLTLVYPWTASAVADGDSGGSVAAGEAGGPGGEGGGLPAEQGPQDDV
ncbi:MAG: hypothetical protein S0880_27650 [Actinomycetota bacterium]|nr:hypothetical protein [Actinomycetota bacterium]